MRLLRHAILRAVLASIVTLLVRTSHLSAAGAENLRGSPTSMLRQYGVARDAGFSFARTTSDLRHLVYEGQLVPLHGNANYAVVAASYPYALPAVRLLIERLSAEYHSATGEKLVVTSLARPSSRQPRNAHPLSVHPAGMAIDLRIPKRTASRIWLERALLSLEAERVLDVTRERRPPHYHVAVFPEEYVAYVGQQVALDTKSAATALVDATAVTLRAPVPPPIVMAAAPGRLFHARDLSLVVLLIPIWILFAPYLSNFKLAARAALRVAARD
jgi:hypothetical protein